ncbi:hypothetical protein BaRGS_00021286 [Batillaria attramentaria]|uniref:Ubiquitin-like domain-containing protein n=1 Tax=Batillaria attramentaria TaxID=370345 RepID=A0ABD0KK52_9CAEN
MSLIEGVGDEVTVGFGILLLMCLVLLAWFSTHTRDIPFVSIIVVELSQRRRLSSRNRNNGSGEPTATGEATSTDAPRPERDAASNQTSEGDAVSADASSSDAPSSRLSGEQGVEHGEPVSPKPTESSPGTRTGDSDTTSSNNVIADSTQASGPSLAQDSETPAVSSQNTAEDTSAESAINPEASSPDEVRKWRVAYFESNRRKEYGETEEEAEEASKPVKSECTEGQSVSASPSQDKRTEAAASSAAGVCDSDSPVSEVTPQPIVGESNSSDRAAETENPSSESQQIRVRLKYLNDTQRLVYASPQETIGNFRRTHFSAELGENKIVRFIFNGQDLRNDLWTLGAYNISDNSVIHCLITQSRQQQETSNNAAALGEDDLEIGVFIYPIFGLILGVLWYFRFSYKQYFNAVSTVSLAGVSFIYCLALVSSLRGRHRPHQHLD